MLLVCPIFLDDPLYATDDHRCPLVMLVTSGAAAGLTATGRKKLALNMTCRQIMHALKGASVLQAKETKEQRQA